jgi:hypothetical protein
VKTKTAPEEALDTEVPSFEVSNNALNDGSVNGAKYMDKVFDMMTPTAK